MWTAVVLLIMSAAILIQAIQIGTLKEKVRTLEICEDQNAKNIALLKVMQQNQPQFNQAIDPYPETPEERDWIIQRLKEEGDR